MGKADRDRLRLDALGDQQWTELREITRGMSNEDHQRTDRRIEELLNGPDKIDALIAFAAAVAMGETCKRLADRDEGIAD